MQNMETMIRAEIKKIKKLKNFFVLVLRNQINEKRNREREREREREKEIWENDFYFYFLKKILLFN